VSLGNVIDPVTLIFDLSITKPYQFLYIPTPSLNTLGSFVFLSYAVNRHTDSQTNNRRSRTRYPHRPTQSESAWIITVRSTIK